MVTENFEGAGPDEPAKSVGREKTLAVNALIITLSLCFSLLIGEAAYRVANGISVFDDTDWRNEGVRTKRIGERAL